jgi:hypothetical protein
MGYRSQEHDFVFNQVILRRIRHQFVHGIDRVTVFARPGPVMPEREAGLPGFRVVEHLQNPAILEHSGNRGDGLVWLAFVQGVFDGLHITNVPVPLTTPKAHKVAAESKSPVR